MTYCSVDDVKLIADISTDDVSNLTDIISSSTAIFNREVNARVRREDINYIDAWHQNDLDGANKTFYLKRPQDGFFIADKDNDGIVDSNDVVMKEWKTDDTISTLTVNSVDSETGKVVVNSPPAGTSKLKATYYYAPINEGKPEELVKQAVAHLSATYALSSLQSNQIKKVSLRTLDMTTQANGFKQHYEKYRDILQRIKHRMTRKT